MQLSFPGAKQSLRAETSAQQPWSWLSPEEHSCHPKSALGASK